MQQVGRYVLLQALADDGTVTVYAAHDPELDREVQVELLAADEAGDRLDRARALAQLGHSALVAVHDAGLHDGRVFIVRERAVGLPLREWMEASRPTWRTLRDVLVQAVRGLAAVHRGGLVHGRIGADAVLVGETGRARLAGLSVAPMAGATREQDVRFLADLAAGAMDGVPRWMSNAIERSRGGDVPTADEMAALLDRDPGRRGMMALVAVVAVSAAAATYVGTRTSLDARCTASTAHLEGVWDASRRDAVETAFSRTNLPFARDAAEGVSAALDGYGAAWSGMRTEICEATRSGQQTDAALDLRMRCLDERLVQLDALVGVLAGADATIVGRAVQAAAELPALATCAEVDRLVDVGSPPVELEERVLGVRRQVAAARALLGAGKYEDGRVEALEAARAANELGFQPLMAEAALALAQLQMRSGQEAASEPTYHAAIRAAMRGHDHRATARAWHGLTFVLGDKLGRMADARSALGMAGAAAERVGDPMLAAAVIHVEGVLFYREGEYERALGKYREGLAIREREHGPGHLSLARAHNNIGNALIALERQDEALEHYTTAREIWREKLGQQHPRVGIIENNMGTVYYQRRDWPAARDAFERARVIREAALGPDHPDVAGTLNNLASVHQEQGHYREALPLHERALEIRRKAYGDEHPETATSLLNLGGAYHGMGDLQRSMASYAEAHRIFVATVGEQHPLVATALLNLGAVARELGRVDEAVSRQRQAVRAAEAAYGADHPAVIKFHQALALSLVKSDRGAEAIPVLTQARRLSGGDRPASERASLAFLLAQARWEAKQDRAGAVSLATDARRLLGDGAEDRELTAEIDVWLAKRK